VPRESMSAGGAVDLEHASKLVWYSDHVGFFDVNRWLADGEGGPPDAAAARAWLQEAAERDYPEALQELALTEPDPQRADALMRAAAHALAHRAHAARNAADQE